MKTDTLTLAEVTEAQANAATATIARYATSRADLLQLLDIVRPAPTAGAPADAPHSAKPRYGI